MALKAKEDLVHSGVGAAIRPGAEGNIGILDLRLISQGNVRGAAKRAAQSCSRDPGTKIWQGCPTHRQDLAVLRIIEIYITVPHSREWPAPGRADLIGVRSAEHAAAAGYSVCIVQCDVVSA